MNSIDETAWFEISEFCAYLHVDRHWIVELVDAGVIEPRGPAPEAWSFPASALERARTTARLVNDLGVNLAGVEIILNMRRRITQMQVEVNEFMTYVKKELARGIDDWEQRLSTALVKSWPTDLVRAHPHASRPAPVSTDATQPARKKTS